MTDHETDQDEPEPEYGWTTISELVRDTTGAPFLHTERFLYYSPAEARALYLESIAAQGFVLTDD